MRNIPELFEKQVAENADRPAVCRGPKVVSYAELNELAERIARTLLHVHGGTPKPVAVLQGHDELAIASILGVIKAGHFVVPLDTAGPDEYLEGALALTRPAALLADRARCLKAQKLASAFSIPVIATHECLGAPRGEDVRRNIEPDNLCYILFTSGSTGAPKGVADTHERILVDTEVFAGHLGITPADRLSWFGSYALGAQTLVIFGALLCGATLHVYDLAERGFAGLGSWINDESITVLNTTPSTLRSFCATLKGGNVLSSVRLVKTTGEPLYRSDVELCRQRLSETCKLVNVFGLTEAKTVGYLEISCATPVAWDKIPVRPDPIRKRIALLDEAGGEVRSGETGELAIISDYLTPGYWDNGHPVRPCPPFGNSPSGEPMYRTGDMAFVDEKGLLHLLGRKDLQVKIRGYRVEVEQVETAMLRCPDIRSAAVTTRERLGEDVMLTAYYVCRPGRTVQPAEIRSFLGHSLPGYMIPQSFTQMKEMPLTAGGKIRRQALLSQDEGDARRTSHSSPHDGVEEGLLRIWREGLRLPEIGVDEDFFDCGGTSLAAAAIFAGIEQQFGVELPLSALVGATTVAKLAEVLLDRVDDALWPILVPLGHGSRRVPFYCVPRAGEDPISLRDLAANLDADQPVLAFRPLGIHDTSNENRGIEQIAAVYADELLHRHSADEPLLLGGASFGGLVAFETARHMCAAKRHVAGLALLDTYGPGYPRPRSDLGVLRRLVLGLLRALPVSDKERPSVSLLKSEIVYRTRYYRERFRSRRGQAPARYKQKYFNLMQKQLAASRDYVPAGPLHCKAMLFRTRHAIATSLYESDPSLGWWAHIPALEISEIPCGHTDVVNPPHLQTLARALQCFLDQAASDPTPVYPSRSG